MRSSVGVPSLLTVLTSVGITPGYAQLLQDPTRPSVMLPSAATAEAQLLEADGFPKVRVSAVMLGGKSRQAVLNGEVVSEGQQWSGLNVVTVHRHGVVLAKDEKRREFLIHANVNVKEHANEF